jgi:predicted MFS family arabinose efflux permease
MGALKWVLVFFALAALGLVVLSKLITFLDPPRPGRPRGPLLRRVERALRWTVLVPLALGVAILVLTILGGK